MRVGIDARWMSLKNSGISVYTRELIKHLALLDRENEYILFFDDERLRERIIAETELKKAGNFSSFLLPYGIYAVRNQLLFPSVIRRLALNVFHSTNYMIPFFAFPRDRGGQIKCVVTVHDLVPLVLPDSSPRSRKKRLFPVYRRLILEVGRRADAVITVSNASRLDVVRYLRIPKSRVTMIKTVYNGVSSQFRPLQSELVGRKDECNRERIILYVGRSDPYKGIVNLVEAFARLLEMCPFPVKLKIAGKRDKRYPEAPERALELGIDEFVEWTGYLANDDLVVAYQEADVFVLPSRCEGFGLPVIEAMTCGTPVVCSNRGALPEVAGDAASYVDPDDIEGLTSAILEVLTDPEVRKRLVAKGLKRARQFTWDSTAQKTLEIYHRLTVPR